jgi:hypothetical protein
MSTISFPAIGTAVSVLVIAMHGTAQANCESVVQIATIAHDAAVNSANAGNDGNARELARIFWEIRGVRHCDQGRRLAANLDAAGLDAVAVHAGVCPKVEMPGSVAFRAVPGYSVNFKKRFAPEEIEVNGIRYRIASFDPEVPKLNLPELLKALPGANSELLKEWPIDLKGQAARSNLGLER